jgi:hypothetical protein
VHTRKLFFFSFLSPFFLFMLSPLGFILSTHGSSVFFSI